MMAYARGYVASIVLDSLPQRESNVEGTRTVRLPFGSEYSILLKNQNPLRAKVQVLIDGMDVSSIGRIVLEPGQVMTLERFLDSYSSGRRFKFISKEEGERTGALQDPTSNKLGLVEIRFWSEVTPTFTDTKINTDSMTFSSVGALRSAKVYCNSNISFAATTNSADKVNSLVGGTAEGSLSNQGFTTASHFAVESVPTVMTIRLLGPEVATSGWAVEDGWVMKMPERVKLSKTFRVENGEMWVKV